jgi:hypothetical protein
MQKTQLAPNVLQADLYQRVMVAFELLAISVETPITERRRVGRRNFATSRPQNRA